MALRHTLIGAAVLALGALPVAAQTSSGTSGTSAGSSGLSSNYGNSGSYNTSTSGAGGSGTGMGRWLGGGAGYMGLSVGRSNYRADCGIGLFDCGDRGTSVALTAGSMANENFGAEVSYVHMGNIDRGGGNTRAQGINLSLVGRLPLSYSFGVFGKVGATYGRTETSANALSGISTGTEHGWGGSYGVGVSYDFTPNMAATLAWDSHDFRFAGGGRDAVRTTSLGLMWRY